MSKYTNNGTDVLNPDGNYVFSTTFTPVVHVVAELNRLLAERDEARRDRDVLAVFIRGGAPLNHDEYYAALSRCTPPATEATNG